MKKIALIIIITLGFQQLLYSQAAWVEPENPDVTQKVKIYCDLSKVAGVNGSADAMKTNSDGPYYIWTWKPAELPTGDPNVNGTGDKPWKSSNDALKMTKDPTKGTNVWYYEMIPTQFYKVSATTIYTIGISFLVKPKDGGGYGDPDQKTEDFSLQISPPKLTRGLIYNIPQTVLGDEITTFYYDNAADTTSVMKNLGIDDAVMWIKCSAKDTSSGTVNSYQPSTFLGASDNPDLKMSKNAEGYFTLSILPRKFFGIPLNYQMIEMECTVRKKIINTLNDRTYEQPKIKFGCK